MWIRGWAPCREETRSKSSEAALTRSRDCLSTSANSHSTPRVGSGESAKSMGTGSSFHGRPVRAAVVGCGAVASQRRGRTSRRRCGSRRRRSRRRRGRRRCARPGASPAGRRGRRTPGRWSRRCRRRRSRRSPCRQRVLRAEVEGRRAEAVRRAAGLPGAVDRGRASAQSGVGVGLGLGVGLGVGFGRAGLRRGRRDGGLRGRARAWATCVGLLRVRRGAGRRPSSSARAGAAGTVPRRRRSGSRSGRTARAARSSRSGCSGRRPAPRPPGRPGCRRRRRGRPPQPRALSSMSSGFFLPSPSPSRATACQVWGRNCIWPTARSQTLSWSSTPLSLSLIAAKAPAPLSWGPRISGRETPSEPSWAPPKRPWLDSTRPMAASRVQEMSQPGSAVAITFSAWW